jgi:hypothetical protein
VKDHTAEIERFFAAYARRFNDSLGDPPVVDSEGVRDSFADYFVGADPAGVRGGKNGLIFRFMVPRGFAHYKKIGTTAMNVTSIAVTPIDDLHVMARVGWDSRYVKDGKEIRIPFENVYLLQMTGEGPKIFAYITGDEQKVLKEHGLV